MSEDPEVPEAKDPFERQVALTVAILAVFLSVISSFMDNARLKALLAESQATDQWAYFQSKSVKGADYELARKNLAILNDSAVKPQERDKLAVDLDKGVEKYAKEKSEIEEKANKLEEQVEYQNERIEKWEHGEVLLHIAIVLGSITILIRMRALWWCCLALGIVGTLLGMIPFFSPSTGSVPKPKEEGSGQLPIVRQIADRASTLRVLI